MSSRCPRGEELISVCLEKENNFLWNYNFAYDKVICITCLPPSRTHCTFHSSEKKKKEGPDNFHTE